MIDFTILNEAGQVLRYGTCMPEMLKYQAKGRERVVEGTLERSLDTPVYTYSYHRHKAYPEIGNQLDAVFKMAVALQEQGITLPEDTAEWVASVQLVKDTYPKGGV